MIHEERSCPIKGRVAPNANMLTKTMMSRGWLTTSWYAQTFHGHISFDNFIILIRYSLFLRYVITATMANNLVGVGGVPPVAPRLIRGTRGMDSRLLVYGDHTYQLNQRRTTLYWRCKNEGCRAFIRTNNVNVQDLAAIPQIVGNNAPVHNHGDDNDQVEKIGIIQQMKDIIIQRPTIAVKTAYNEVVTRLHQQAGAAGAPPPNIPNFSSASSALQRTKAAQCPPIPHTINQVQFPGAFGQTHLRERYLLHLNQNTGVALFSTDVELRFLANAQRIYVDGTFKTAPRPFTQLFTIHAEHLNRVINLAAALLTGKQQVQYQEIFNVLHQEMLRVTNGIPALIQEVVSDFELAVFNAVVASFPNAQVSGCYFHFTQNLWKHTQELGLAGAFQLNPALKVFLTHVYSLGFVPLGHVPLCFNQLVTDPQTQQLVAQYPNLHTFIQYVHNTYIVGQQFPPDTWNVFNRGMSARTNNFVESFHAQWNKSVGVRHPSIWQFVAKLQDQQALSRNSLNNAVNGNPVVRRRAKWVRLENRINTLKGQYLAGQRTVQNYWSAVRHQIQQFK